MSTDIKQELRRFAESTSIKGVGRSVKANRRTVRVFWMSALIVCSALLFYQIITVFISYFSYSVIRNSGVVAKQPRFPDVTVCNAIPASNLPQVNTYTSYKNALKKLSSAYAYASAILSQSNTPFLGLVNTFSFSNNATAGKMLLDYTFAWRSEAMVYSKCLLWPRVTPPLQWCLTISCDLPANSFGFPSLVAIFTDNSFRKNSTNGFNMLSPTGSGLNVMIHPKDFYADPDQVISVSPGTVTTISVTKTNITRLPAPWGTCTHQKYLNPNDDTSPIYDYTLCQSICGQQMTINKCGCLDHTLYFTNAQLLAANNIFCLDMTETLDQVIQDGVVSEELLNKSLEMISCWKGFTPNQSSCDCPIQCTQVECTQMLATAPWPDPIYQLNFYQNYIQNNEYFMGAFDVYETILNNSQYQSVSTTFEQLENVNLIEKNFLQLIVQFQFNNVQTIMDIPAMTWDTMASNLGGSLNLWLGLSVLTFAEVIELMYDVVMICRARHKKNPTVGASDLEDSKDGVSKNESVC